MLHQEDKVKELFEDIYLLAIIECRYRLDQLIDSVVRGECYDIHSAACGGHQLVLTGLKGMRLHYLVYGAAGVGAQSFVMELLAKGASLNDAVYGAARGGHQSLINQLIVKGASVYDAVNGAAEVGHLKEKNILRFITFIDNQDLRKLLAERFKKDNDSDLTVDQLLANAETCIRLIKDIGIDFEQAQSLLTQPEVLDKIFLSRASSVVKKLRTLLHTLIEAIEGHSFVLNSGKPLPTNGNVVSDTAFEVFTLARATLLSGEQDESLIRSKIEIIRGMLESKSPDRVTGFSSFFGHIPGQSHPSTLAFYRHLLDEIHQVMPKSSSDLNTVEEKATFMMKDKKSRSSSSSSSGDENNAGYSMVGL